MRYAGFFHGKKFDITDIGLQGLKGIHLPKTRRYGENGIQDKPI